MFTHEFMTQQIPTIDHDSSVLLPNHSNPCKTPDAGSSSTGLTARATSRRITVDFPHQQQTAIFPLSRVVSKPVTPMDVQRPRA